MIRLILVAIAITVSVSACDQMTGPVSNTVPETPAEPMTEEQKTFYALGLAVAQSMSQFDLTESEKELVTNGLRDGMSGEENDIDPREYQQKFAALSRARMAAAAEKLKAASAGFLDEMAAMEGAQQFESGLIVIEEVAGDGEQPAATDSVTVHYHGTLQDGTVFDSSVERGTPATFPLNGVIACWTEGVQKIKVGGKAKLVCPSDIAYGDGGRPPTIPPAATLVFDVELLGIEGTEEPTE